MVYQAHRIKNELKQIKVLLGLRIQEKKFKSNEIVRLAELNKLIAKNIKAKKLKKWKQMPEEYGGLRHVTEAQDSYLETSRSEDDKLKKGVRKTHFRPVKRISESLIVPEKWEIELESEASMIKEDYKDDEEVEDETGGNTPKNKTECYSPQRKKKLSMDLPHQGEHDFTPMIHNTSVSSGETQMQTGAGNNTHHHYHQSLQLPI